MPRSQKGGLATARGAHDGHQVAGLVVSGDGRLSREASQAVFTAGLRGSSASPYRQLPGSASFAPHEAARRRKPL